jgi:hypothetical protein
LKLGGRAFEIALNLKLKDAIFRSYCSRDLLAWTSNRPCNNELEVDYHRIYQNSTKNGGPEFT